MISPTITLSILSVIILSSQSGFLLTYIAYSYCLSLLLFILTLNHSLNILSKCVEFDKHMP